MNRVAILAGAVVIAATAPGAVAAPSPSASCAGIITSFEATELPAGSVGAETSALAGGGLGAIVSGLARSHFGSLEECAAGAP